MNLVGMEVFARVVQAGSFSAAARRLRLSKSVVSKHVTQLERDVGSQLLLRSTRALTLTEIGRDFYTRCARMLDAAEQAELAANRLQSAPLGTLRIAAPVSFGTECLAPLLHELLVQHEGLRAELTLTNQAVSLVEEGFDLSVVMRGTLPPAMTARRIGTIAQRLCASSTYVAAHGAPGTPGDLAQHNCLIFREESAERVWAFRRDEGTVEARVDGALHVNNLDAIRNAARAGGGVALLPDYLADKDLAADLLEELLPDWEPVPVDVHVVYPPGRNVSPKIRALVDFLMARFEARETR